MSLVSPGQSHHAIPVRAEICTQISLSRPRSKTSSVHGAHFPNREPLHRGEPGTGYVPSRRPWWPHVPTPSRSNENSQRPGKQAVPRWMYLGANTGTSQGVVPRVKEEGVRRTVCLIVAGPLQDTASNRALGLCAAVHLTCVRTDVPVRRNASANTRRSSNALLIRRQDNGVIVTLFWELFQWDFFFLMFVMLRKGLPFVWFECIFFLFRISSLKVLTNSQVNYQGVQ